eukprot:COSAG02_NODE_22472_length_751_cov_1.638037_1_plen_164_part_10
MGLGSGLGFCTVALATPRTAYCCSALRRTHRTHRTRRARRTRSAEQLRHTGQRGAQCQRVPSLWIVSIDVVLAGFLASLPFYYQSSSRAREELHRPQYRRSISDTELVSRDTPPVSQIPGWYPSCCLAGRPGGSRHRPHITLMLFAAQVTEGGISSSAGSIVSG